MAAAVLPGRRGVIPGFGITLGSAMAYLGLLVLLPLSALLIKAAGLTPAQWLGVAFSARALAAYRLSFGGALLAAVVNLPAGLLVAWVLVRYRFPGRRVVDAMVDLPFALPTAVAGISLTAIYAPNGPIGGLLAPFGIKTAYSPLGVVLAMIFIGLPFVVRTVQPVLEDFDPETEEAAASLGAGRLAVFARIILPALAPALLTGFAMAFARAIGEYGSVIFIAGNLPGISEIAPVLIVIRLEQFDYAGAAAIASVMLVASLLLLVLINLLQRWQQGRVGVI